MKESVSIVSSCDTAACYVSIHINIWSLFITDYYQEEVSVCSSNKEKMEDWGEAMEGWKWRWITSQVAFFLCCLLWGQNP